MTQWGLDNLFNPGKRHMDDEKRRLQSTREEIGDSSGGRRIDLERGTVSITVPKSADVAADGDADDPAEGSPALDPALEAADVPAVALASDEAEIEPEVIDEAPVPVVEPDPAPPTLDQPPATPRRRGLSANAWARRG